MNETLLLIANAFMRFGRDHDYHGLIDMCVDPDDGYFTIRLDGMSYSRIDSDGTITCHRYKETDTTGEE